MDQFAGRPVLTAERWAEIRSFEVGKLWQAPSPPPDYIDIPDDVMDAYAKDPVARAMIGMDDPPVPERDFILRGEGKP